MPKKIFLKYECIKYNVTIKKTDRVDQFDLIK